MLDRKWIQHLLSNRQVARRDAALIVFVCLSVAAVVVAVVVSDLDLHSVALSVHCTHRRNCAATAPTPAMCGSIGTAGVATRFVVTIISAICLWSV